MRQRYSVVFRTYQIKLEFTTRHINRLRSSSLMRYRCSVVFPSLPHLPNIAILRGTSIAVLVVVDIPALFRNLSHLIDTVARGHLRRRCSAPALTKQGNISSAHEYAVLRARCLLFP